MRCATGTSGAPLNARQTLQNAGADVQQLKDYVAGSDGGMQRQAQSTVRLHVTHSNLKAKFIEVRLDQHVSPCLDQQSCRSVHRAPWQLLVCCCPTCPVKRV
jgi:hypothetical protein